MQPGQLDVLEAGIREVFPGIPDAEVNRLLRTVAGPETFDYGMSCVEQLKHLRASGTSFGVIVETLVASLVDQQFSGSEEQKLRRKKVWTRRLTPDLHLYHGGWNKEQFAVVGGRVLLELCEYAATTEGDLCPVVFAGRLRDSKTYAVYPGLLADLEACMCEVEAELESNRGLSGEVTRFLEGVVYVFFTQFSALERSGHK